MCSLKRINKYFLGRIEAINVTFLKNFAKEEIIMQRKRIPRRFWRKFTKTKLYNIIPDKWAVKIKYRNHFNKKLDLKNPQTFNEKLQWLKLYDRKPEYTMMVDKLAVKQYVADKIGEEYIIPTLGSWDSFDEIDFDSLPNQFVLKCTHSSADTVICKDKAKFDKELAKKKLEKSLHTDYYLVSREWPYKSVPRKIIAEKYMEDSETHEARDYKFFCFNGKVKCFKVDFDRFKEQHTNWYDAQLKLLPVRAKKIHNTDKTIDLPANISKMMELAEILSMEVSFLRVDFYSIDNRIYFGELTFFPGSGLLPFNDEKWDEQMGEWLVLPCDSAVK